MIGSSFVVTLVCKAIVALVIVINLLQCSTTPLSIVSAAAAAVTTKAKFVFDKTSYFPGETMKINITRVDNRTSNDELRIVIAPANATDTDLVYGDQEINVHHRIEWKVKKDSMVIDINFVQYVEGLYKVGLIKVVTSVQRYKLLGVSDNIRINNPTVSINLPKKEFFQGEAVTFTFNNPYFNLTYEPLDVWTMPPSYRGHRFKIVPTYPSVYEKLIPMTTGSSQVSESFIVPYDHDEYKIILERYYYLFSQMADASLYIITIAEVQNSTFTVKRNYPTIDVEAAARNTCSNERIRVSLTTMNNIPLTGPYVVGVVLDGGESSPARAFRKMQMKTGVVPTTRLNTTISFTPGYITPYRVRILLDDYKLWALSPMFYAGCF